MDLGDKPAFWTSGLAMLPGPETDPAKRGVISVRPTVNDLQSNGLNQLVSAGVTGVKPFKATTPLGEFSTIRPVVLDIGVEDAAKVRFWALAVGEKPKAGDFQRELWALPMDAKGVDGTPTKWLDSAVPGPGATTLAGVSAVCSLDAAWDVGKGEAVVVMVVRQDGQDRVWLARGAGGKWVSTLVVAKGSKSAGCDIGISHARVSANNGKAMVLMNDLSGGSFGVGRYVLVSGDKAGPDIELTMLIKSTDVSGMTAPATALAARGLAAPVWHGESVSLIWEANSPDGKRAIAIHTVVP